MYLCLDPSIKRTGYCFIDIDGKIIESGSVKSASPDSTLHQKLDNFEYQVEALFRKKHIKGLFFEQILLLKKRQRIEVLELAGYILSKLKYWCDYYRIPYVSYTPTEIKLHSSGYGKASKKQVIEAVIKKTGITPKNDDEADAIAIALTAQGQFYETIQTNSYKNTK